MAGPTLAQIPDVGKALGIASEKQVEQAEQMQELFRQLGTAHAASAEAARTGTIGNSLETPATILFKDTEQLKADLLKSNAAAAAGMDPNTAVNVMDIMLRDIRDTGLKMREVAGRLAEEKSVSLFDDPLQALANAFTIPWTEQELKGLVEQQERSKKTLTDLTSGVTNVAVTAENVRAKVDQAGIVDRQRAIAKDLENQARVFQVKGIEANINGVQAAMAATKQTLDLSVTYNNWLHTQESRALIAQQRQLAIEERQARLKATNDIATAEAEMLKYYNIAATKEGLPNFISVGQMKSRIVTPEEKKRIDDMINRGMLLENPNSFTAKTYTQGTSVDSILRFRDANGIKPKNRDEEEIINAMRKAKLDGEKLGKTEDERNGHADKLFSQWFNEKQTVKRDDNTNPFRAPAFETMADPRTSISKHPVFQTVIAPLINDGNRKQSAHPDLIGEMVAKAVSEKKITINQAVEFTKDFYVQSALIVNEDLQIQKITGMRQNQFRARVDAGIDTGNVAAGAGTTLAGAAIAPFLPPVGGAIALLGTGMTASAFNNTKREFNFMDETEIRAYYTRKVVSNLMRNDSAPTGIPSRPTR